MKRYMGCLMSKNEDYGSIKTRIRNLDLELNALGSKKLTSGERIRFSDRYKRIARHVTRQKFPNSNEYNKLNNLLGNVYTRLKNLGIMNEESQITGSNQNSNLGFQKASNGEDSQYNVRSYGHWSKPSSNDKHETNMEDATKVDIINEKQHRREQKRDEVVQVHERENRLQNFGEERDRRRSSPTFSAKSLQHTNFHNKTFQEKNTDFNNPKPSRKEESISTYESKTRESRANIESNRRGCETTTNVTRGERNISHLSSSKPNTNSIHQSASQDGRNLSKFLSDIERFQNLDNRNNRNTKIEKYEQDSFHPTPTRSIAEDKLTNTSQRYEDTNTPEKDSRPGRTSNIRELIVHYDTDKNYEETVSKHIYDGNIKNIEHNIDQAEQRTKMYPQSLSVIANDNETKNYINKYSQTGDAFIQNFGHSLCGHTKTCENSDINKSRSRCLRKQETNIDEIRNHDREHAQKRPENPIHFDEKMDVDKYPKIRKHTNDTKNKNVEKNSFLQHQHIEIAKEAEEQPSLQILDVHQYFRDDFDINSIDDSLDHLSKIQILESAAQSYEDKVSKFSEEKYSLEYFVLDEKLMRLIEKLDKIKCHHDQEASQRKIQVIGYIKSLHSMLDERAKED